MELHSCRLVRVETIFPDSGVVFQQDNAPCQKAEIGQESFEENSPDLHPMVNSWDVLDIKVQSLETLPHSLWTC